MITCPVCGTANDDLATTCASCKSYVQAKVDTLNLFETAWKLIESPRPAFKKIVLARHKNYVFLLSSLLGVSLVYGLMWFRNLAPHFPNLFVLLGAGLVLGPPAGILFVFLMSRALHILARPFGGGGTARNVFSVVAYAGIPVILSLAFVFPVEMAVFGQDFFGRNPPPIVINPGVYVALLSFDALAVIWSVYLLSEGIGVATGTGRTRSVLLTVTVIALAVTLAFLTTVLW